MICKASGDDAFAAFAGTITDAAAEESNWGHILRAQSTSWDWPRRYAAIESLATLAVPDPDDVRWASRQLGEVHRAEEAVRRAPVEILAGARVAVVDDPAIPARVRPDALSKARTDVDAIAFAPGSGKVTILPVHVEGSAELLARLAQAVEDADHAGLSAALHPGRIDVARAPEPSPVEEPLLDGLSSAGVPGEAGWQARIEHPVHEHGQGPRARSPSPGGRRDAAAGPRGNGCQDAPEAPVRRSGPAVSHRGGAGARSGTAEPSRDRALCRGRKGVKAALRRRGPGPVVEVSRAETCGRKPRQRRGKRTSAQTVVIPSGDRPTPHRAAIRSTRTRPQ